MGGDKGGEEIVQSAITTVEEPSILLNSADDDMLTVGDIFVDGDRGSVVR